MTKIKIAIAVIAVILATPTVVSAASTAPSFNPLCWKKGSGSGDERGDTLSCRGARQKWMGINDPDVGNGWVKDQTCGGDSSEWGKCLPPGRTVASIALGGKRTFYNAGDYIQTIYKIAVSLAGVLAAIMMIIAGAEWVASGGNTEVIGRAKKRIGGAAAGLVLAFGSYLFLNTINPALVNLRLPQTYMIRSITMSSFWCSEFSDPKKYSDPAVWTTKFAEAGSSAHEVNRSLYDSLKPDKYIYTSLATSTDQKTMCGKQYFPQGGGGVTCYGDFGCPEGERCAAPIESGAEFSCDDSRIIGVVINSASIPTSVGDLCRWESPILDNNSYVESEGLMEVQGNFKNPKAIGTFRVVDLSNGKQIFKIKVDDTEFNQDSRVPVSGYVIKLWANESCSVMDDTVYVGQNGVDLGSEEDMKGANSNLYFTADQVKKGFTFTVDFGNIKNR